MFFAPSFRELRSRLRPPTTGTLARLVHPRTNTPRNLPPNTTDRSVTTEQTSEGAAGESSKTGIINKGESSQYGNEQTRSGTHQEIVEMNAAFNPELTTTEQAKKSAHIERQSRDAGNPLEYSGATPEVSQVTADDKPVEGKRNRAKASGGSKQA